MKYTVSINEAKRTVTVTLADGTKGSAKCCPTDRFDINTGIELALERAKVASKSKSTPAPAKSSVMELVHALEAILPKGQMVVVGSGSEMTEEQKKWLASLIGINPNGCKCNKKGYDEGYDEGHEDGYDEGYEDGYDACLKEVKSHNEDIIEDVLCNIREMLEDVMIP